MGRYNFVSGGAAAGNAFEEFFMQREALNRQRMLDQFLKDKEANGVAQQEKDRAMREQELALQREREQRVAADQQAMLDDLAKQHEFSQVERAVEGARPDDAPLDPDMVGKVQRQGFGSRLRQIPGVLMQGPMEAGDQMSEADREADLGRTPEQTALRPGSKYLDAEAQREATKALAGQAEAGRNERAQAENQLRTMIATLAASGKAESVALANQLKAMQVQLLGEKVQTSKDERTQKASAASMTRQTVRDLAQGLLDDPDLNAIAGPVAARVMTVRPDSADAEARLRQLLASLALTERSKLKGQGQISDYEAKILANAVSSLDLKAGPENVKKHLRDIVAAFSGDTPNDGPSTPGGATDAEARAAEFLKNRGRGNGR